MTTLIDAPSPSMNAGVRADEVAFRQLRHHTRNALQRILCQIAQARDLQATVQGRRLVGDLERRVRLSSTVSDALFGVLSNPGPLEQRLRTLGEATVELLGDPDQVLTLRAAVEVTVPAPAEEALLRIVHEMVGNAVKHGMHARSVGTITVRVERGPGGAVQVQVLDDGWGFRCDPEPGEGLRICSALAEAHGGSVRLLRRNGVTVAEALLHGR